MTLVACSASTVHVADAQKKQIEPDIWTFTTICAAKKWGITRVLKCTKDWQHEEASTMLEGLANDTKKLLVNVAQWFAGATANMWRCVHAGQMSLAMYL